MLKYYGIVNKDKRSTVATFLRDYELGRKVYDEETSFVKEGEELYGKSILDYFFSSRAFRVKKESVIRARNLKKTLYALGSVGPLEMSFPGYSFYFPDLKEYYAFGSFGFITGGASWISYVKLIGEAYASALVYNAPKYESNVNFGMDDLSVFFGGMALGFLIYPLGDLRRDYKYVEDQLKFNFEKSDLFMDEIREKYPNL